MPSEFDIIRRFFDRPTRNVELGVGDDCALIRVAAGMKLAVSTDMLVSGRHFLPDTDPRQLGYKSLAVNLSDIAAMGAAPRWATLALALPEADEAWLAAFSAGLFSLAEAYQVELVGGDTTRGPLTISITILGEVPIGTALRRSGAKAGDAIWVSGTLGDAALGLAHLQKKIVLADAARAMCLASLHTPTPRIALGLALRGIANAAIDISDGLIGDLGHICARSNVSAELQFDALPKSAAFRSCMDSELATYCVLAGGDDYELCFTAAPEMDARIGEITAALDLPLTRIGKITPRSKATATGPISLLDARGNAMAIPASGFDHFG